MEKTYIQKMSELTQKAVAENDQEELNRIYKELLGTDEPTIALTETGIEFFLSKLTIEQLNNLKK